MPAATKQAHPKAPAKKRNTKPAKVADDKAMDIAAQAAEERAKREGKSEPDVVSRVAAKSDEEVNGGKSKEEAAKQATDLADPKRGRGKKVGEAVEQEREEKKANGKAARKGLMSVVEPILREHGPMSVKDIVEALPEGTFSDVPTPPTTRTYVQLHAHLKDGKTPRTVLVGRGVFDLHELNPDGDEQRPKAKRSRAKAAAKGKATKAAPKASKKR